MNFKKGDKVYIVVGGKIFEETASRDFWQIDAKLYKTQEEAEQSFKNEKRISFTSTHIPCDVIYKNK